METRSEYKIPLLFTMSTGFNEEDARGEMLDALRHRDLDLAVKWATITLAMMRA